MATPNKNRSVMVEGTEGGTPVEISAPSGVPVEIDAIEVIGSAEGTAVAAGADVFGADLVVPADGVLLIGISFSGKNPSVNMDIVRSATTMSADINEGGTMQQGRWFFFVYSVKEDDEVNFQPSFGGGGTVTTNMTVSLERV